MTLVIGLWVLPLLGTIGVWLWISYGFDYSGDYNFTPLFTLPLGGMCIAIVWMLYFMTLYFFGGPSP